MLNKHFYLKKKKQQFYSKWQTLPLLFVEKKKKKNDFDNIFDYKQNSLSGKKKYNCLTEMISFTFKINIFNFRSSINS